MTALLTRRQLHLLGLEEFAFADSCVLMSGGADPELLGLRDGVRVQNAWVGVRAMTQEDHRDKTSVVE